MKSIQEAKLQQNSIGVDSKALTEAQLRTKTLNLLTDMRSITAAVI